MQGTQFYFTRSGLFEPVSGVETQDIASRRCGRCFVYGISKQPARSQPFNDEAQDIASLHAA